MNWNSAIRTACLVVLTGGCFWGGSGLTKHIIVAFDNWGNQAPDIKPVLTALLRKCDPGPCGPIEGAVKVETKVGDAVVTTQLQERQIAPAMAAKFNTTMDAVATIPPHVNMAADAGTGSLAQLQVDLVSLNAPIKAMTPILLNVNDTVEDVDGAVKEDRPVFHTFMVNANGAMDSGNLLAYDFHVWTHPLLNPDPCKTKECTFDRKVWPVVKTVLGLSNDAGGIRAAFGWPIKVKVAP